MDGTTESMKSLINKVKASSCSIKIKEIFERCFVNTWQTTIKKLEDDTYFVITGDIPAMWLRDSSMQVIPYLRLNEDEQIKEMFRGIIRKQAFYIGIDAYANAFNSEPNGNCWDKNDRTDYCHWNWERKYELDSLCFPLYMAERYLQKTNDCDVFDNVCKAAYERILDVFETEQHHELRSGYFFERETDKITETLACSGRGTPVGYTGMIWSGFRPSDDACTYGYLVPSNMLACAALDGLREINRRVWNDEIMEKRARMLKEAIINGIRTFAEVEKDGKRMYAYETDGLGNYVFMDDANYPSLLSAAYFGFCDINDEIYQNTREFVLSNKNPFYFEGKQAAGIGSPHTPDGYIWPLALIMQGLTSNAATEKREIIDVLIRTEGGTGYMHESFCADDATQYTRPWFSWANSMFCELVLDAYCIE